MLEIVIVPLLVNVGVEETAASLLARRPIDLSLFPSIVIFPLLVAFTSSEYIPNEFSPLMLIFPPEAFSTVTF